MNQLTQHPSPFHRPSVWSLEERLCFPHVKFTSDKHFLFSRQIKLHFPCFVIQWGVTLFLTKPRECTLAFKSSVIAWGKREASLPYHVLVNELRTVFNKNGSSCTSVYIFVYVLGMTGEPSSQCLQLSIRKKTAIEKVIFLCVEVTVMLCMCTLHVVLEECLTHGSRSTGM